MKQNKIAVADTEEQTHEIHKFCLRCGRILKSDKSREMGYGTICYRKMLASKHTLKSLF